MDVAGALFSGARKVLEPLGIDLAAQCCEHLNRALVVERRVQEQYDLEQVNAIPQPNHAGGAFGTVAYQEFQDPVLVESLNQRGRGTGHRSDAHRHAHPSGGGAGADQPEDDRKRGDHLREEKAEVCRRLPRHL